MKENIDYVVCQICQGKFKQLSGHLKHKHNLTLNEYKKKFNSPTICRELSNRLSNTIKSKNKEWGYNIFSNNTKETRNQKIKNMHERLKKEDMNKYQQVRNDTCLKMRQIKGDNFKHSEETKQRMSEKRKLNVGWNHKPETIEKIRKKAIGRTGHVHSEETKQKMRDAWIIRKNSKNYSEYIRNLSIQSAKNLNNQKSYDTNIERDMKSFLEEKQIEYIHQYQLNNYSYDFYIPSMNLIIETDGEYWHQSIVSKDIIKHESAIQSGFRFVRVSDMNWIPEIIFESEEIIKQHNENIYNHREIKNLINP